MKPKPIQKLYYSISEVSEITSVKPHVLRYWETEFDELKPRKNRAGNRIYRLNDIKLIFQIKKLLYEDKFTIEGTKKKLALLQNKRSTQISMPFQKTEKENLIKSIRNDVLEILHILEGQDSKNSEQEIEFPMFFNSEADKD